MRIHLIIFAMLISALSASSQNAHISIKADVNSSQHIIYQKLDKYSLIDSVAVDDEGRAEIDVVCSDEYQFFRLITGRHKLPMILKSGDSISVSINTANIYKSEISGSAESEYLIKGLAAKNDIELKHLIKNNPDMMANVLLAYKLDISKNLNIVKDVAERFGGRQLPIIEELKNRIRIAETIRKGEPAPQFSVTCNNGEILSTAGYGGCEYTILFWAQWNLESAHAVRRYQMIKPDRKVLSVELDENVNYMDNSAAIIYNVTELPLIIEIDKKGRISKILKPGSKYQTGD